MAATIRGAGQAWFRKSQIVFGTDYPYRTGAEHVTGLTARFNTQDPAAIDRGNAQRLLPAWR